MTRRTQYFGVFAACLLWTAAILGVSLWVFAMTGCSTIKDTPIVGDIVPDLTDPAELRDAAELAGALVLQNNPRHVEAIRDAVLTAQHAIDTQEVITRAMWDRWVDDLLRRTIEDPVIRIFARQRFDRAWERNARLIDVSGLLLREPKHRELAEAFVAGLEAATAAFAEAQQALPPSAPQAGLERRGQREPAVAEAMARFVPQAGESEEVLALAAVPAAAGPGVQILAYASLQGAPRNQVSAWRERLEYDAIGRAWAVDWSSGAVVEISPPAPAGLQLASQPEG